MRGPGYRIAGDTRRTWRCSNCGRERKRLGDVTSLLCDCREGAWMQIVAERILAPRPIQRPTDIEMRPSDFGIEPPPPPPPKPESTIIKSALGGELDFKPEETPDKAIDVESSPENATTPEDDAWNLENLK